MPARLLEAAAGRRCTRARRGPFVPRVEHRVVRLEPLGHVVRVQDRDLRRPRQARRRPSSRCTPTRSSRMLALPHGAADDRRRSPRSPPVATTGWPGRNGARCAATQIGPMPGPPPPCGMQKVLCRFRWQTSAPMSPGPAEPDLRVHVRAVHVHLAAVLVDDLADLADRPPRTRRASTGRSPSAPPSSSLCSLGLAPRRSARSTLPSSSHATTTTLQPGHHRARRVGAVRATTGSGRRRGAPAPRLSWYARITSRPGVLALRAGVRLQRHRGEAGDLGEPAPRAR